MKDSDKSVVKLKITWQAFGRVIETVGRILKALELLLLQSEQNYVRTLKQTVTLTGENGLTITFEGAFMQLLHDDKVISFTVAAVKDARGRPLTFSAGPTWGVASSLAAVFTPLPVAADGSTGGSFDGSAGSVNGECSVQLTGTLSDGTVLNTSYGVNVVSEDAAGFPAAVFGSETDPVPATGGTTPPVTTTVDVLGGSPFPDVATFSDAATAYTGGVEIDLDGAVIKAGTSPKSTYVTQVDGSVAIA